MEEMISDIDKYWCLLKCFIHSLCKYIYVSIYVQTNTIYVRASVCFVQVFEASA